MPVRCLFDSSLDCRRKAVNGVYPCLTCVKNKGQLALGVFC
jgi:hypothetical protein